MSEATVDPTLDALVPRGSAARSAAFVALGLALLAGLWFLPPLLRPDVVGHSAGGSAGWFAGDRRVVFFETLHPQGPGEIRVLGVEDVPGARVVDAWVLDGDHFVPPDAIHPGPAGEPQSASDYLAVGVPAADESTHLPRWIAAGRTATLVVLWEIRDCGALSGELPSVRLATRWGATRTQPLLYNPFASGTARDTGTCGS